MKNTPVNLNFREKIVAWEQLPRWRQAVRQRGRKLVVTNGCFDLLHAGHVTYLEAARNLGDALLVGLNSDASVRALKGPKRPLNTEGDRAVVLAALECVTGVCIFSEKTATQFLERAQPDLYVKGGDYTLDTLNQEERRAAEKGGGRIKILGLVKGRSTTELLERLAQHEPLQSKHLWNLVDQASRRARIPTYVAQAILQDLRRMTPWQT